MTMYQIYSFSGRWIAQTINLAGAQTVARNAGGWIEDEDNPGTILYDYR